MQLLGHLLRLAVEDIVTRVGVAVGTHHSGPGKTFLRDRSPR